jgi:hypothetical protein
MPPEHCDCLTMYLVNTLSIFMSACGHTLKGLSRQKKSGQSGMDEQPWLWRWASGGLLFFFRCSINLKFKINSHREFNRNISVAETEWNFASSYYFFLKILSHFRGALATWYWESLLEIFHEGLYYPDEKFPKDTGINNFCKFHSDVKYQHKYWNF